MHSIVAGYLCFLPFVPSFLVTLVSSPLLIHLPPRAHIRRAAASRSPHPVPCCGRSKKKKEKKKEKKHSVDIQNWQKPTQAMQAS
jgi:hypothetical protein